MKITVPKILDLKSKRQITMMTAYDFPTSKAVSEAQIDIILVGDSLAQVVLGHDDTLSVTMDEMLQSGFKAGWFGVETLYHEAGKAAGKGLRPEKVKYLMNELKRKSPEFWLTTYFIIGLPKETPESLDDTLEYLTKQRIIDEVQVSVLGVAPFIEELSSVVDFSDHSKMPEKFGFRKLQFTPTFYWEHDTLNNLQCNEIREKWKQTFYDHPYTRYGGGAHGEYPRIRDLGLDHKQTVVFLKTKFLGGNKILNITKNLFYLEFWS